MHTKYLFVDRLANMTVGIFSINKKCEVSMLKMVEFLQMTHILVSQIVFHQEIDVGHMCKNCFFSVEVIIASLCVLEAKELEDWIDSISTKGNCSNIDTMGTFQ